LDEACTALPTTSILLTQGLDQQLVELVEACRARAIVQKRVIEREMEVWQIIEEQKRTEIAAQSPGASKGTSHISSEMNMGEAKRLQRGSVGSDRGG
jgi:indoleamine 2,3-dioxygenase